MFQFIEIPAVSPEVLERDSYRPNARLETLYPVRPCTDCCPKIGGTVFHDLEMKRAQNYRQVNAGSLQHCPHLIVVDLFPPLDHGYQSRCFRDTFRANVPIHGIDNIVCRQRLTVVELHASSEFECPSRRISVRPYLFRQLRLVAQVWRQARQRPIEHSQSEIVCGG